MSYSFARPGFRGFRRPREVAPEIRDFIRDRFGSDNRYVLYTGGAYGFRRASGRIAVLKTVSEVRTPVPLSDFLSRAADAGFEPGFAVSGLGLHSGAKPAVYLYLYAEPGPDGATVFRAVKDIPYPDPLFSDVPFARDAVVFTVPAAPVEASPEAEEAAPALPAPEASAEPVAPVSGRRKGKRAAA